MYMMSKTLSSQCLPSADDQTPVHQQNDPDIQSDEHDEPRKIIVTNLPTSCSKSLLENYFENKRVFADNMVVTAVELDQEKTQAIVEFENGRGVDVVLSKQPCELAGNTLSIEVYQKVIDSRPTHESDSDVYTSIMVNDTTATIEVGNFHTSTTSDTLQFYFENEKRSGGGDITNVTIDWDEKVAHITFKNKTVVERVLKKKHVVNGQLLTVKAYITSDMDVLIKEIPDTLTKENLSNYIEAKFKNAIAHMTFNEEHTKAIVTFTETADFQLITDACKKYALDGAHVIAARVPITNCIVVTNLPENGSTDTYRFYFELPRHGGGDVDNVDFHATDGYCLVYFHDIKVVESVCRKKDHMIGETHVQVKPYQTSLGIPASSDSAKFTFPTPEILSDVDVNKQKFLQRNDTQRKALDKRLASCHGHIVWDMVPVHIECTLTTKVRGYRELSRSWQKTVKDSFQQSVKILDVKKHNVTEDTFQNILDKIGSLNISHPDGMAVFVEKDKLQITLVGHVGVVEKTWPLMKAAITEAEHEVKELKTVTTDNKGLKAWQAKYLNAVHFVEDMKRECPKVNVKLDQKKCKINFKGPKSEVSSAQVQMYQRLKEVMSSKVNIGKESVQLLQNEQTEGRINEQMRQHNLGDVWEMKDGDLIVYGDSDSDLDKMRNVVMKVLIKTTISLDTNTRDILGSSKWKKKKSELEKKHSGCVVFNLNTDKDCMEVFTIDTVENEIVPELQGFLSNNAVYSEQMTVDPCVADFIKRVFGEDLKTCLDKSKQKGEAVHISFTKGGVVNIEGSRNGLATGKGIINNLEGKVKSKKHTVKQPNIQGYMATEQWRECKQNLESTIPCIVDLMATGRGRSHGGQGQRGNKQPFNKPTPCAEATLQGVKVTVIGGDMLSMDVDVVVNAANKEMNHVGGLAAAIVKKGGEIIQDECFDYLKSGGRMSNGDVFMSSPGSLKVQAIAHAVGPVWNGGKQGEKQELQLAITNCLSESEQQQYRSIAFPALSCGMFHYPVDQACLAIVEAIDQYFIGKSSIRDVYLCDITENTVNALVQALKQVSRHTKVFVQLGQGDAPRPAWLDPATLGHKHSRSDSHEHSFGNTAVILKKGELAKEAADVIVNSASHDLDLEKGASSKALSSAAGQQLQQECSDNFPDGVETGDVAMTTGVRLPCKKVFHVAIDPWKSGPGAIHGLRKTVDKCLKEADKQGFSSISFPAMGTGAQRYPKVKVAECMFTCISGFCNKHPRTSIQTVHLVIFPEDEPTWEAFKMEENKWSGQDDHQPPTHYHSNATPGLGKLVKSSKGCAEFKIGSIQLFVSQGDITDQTSDAIVASCNRDLDLSKGAVTKAIVKKGGSEIEQDCETQRAAMKRDGIAVTTAGQLKSKYIIHVDTKYKAWEWEEVINNCLREAEERKMSSLSFPALGTSVGSKPQDIARIMYASLAEFLRGSVNHLTVINVVIFQQEMIQPFINSFKSSIDGKDSSQGSEGHDQQQRGSGKTPDRVTDSNSATDSCTMTIYAGSIANIDKAMKRLDKIIDKQWHTKTLDDSGIFKLQQNQMERIKIEAENNHCHVIIDQDRGIITIRGLVTDVMNVNDKVHLILRSLDKSTYEKNYAQQLKNVVRWHYLNGQKQLPFPDLVNVRIETAFKDKKANVRIKDRSGGEYEIDFNNMEEVDIKNPANKFAVIRRDLLQDVSSVIPKTWQQMKDKENLLIVTLQSASAEYQKVVADLTKTLGRTPNIITIERIQNRTLYTQYVAKRDQINQSNTRKDNERMLWHGTDSSTVTSINTHGFNRSYCGLHGTAIGNGVYFADAASYSDGGYARADAAGHKRMFHCLVLTGEFCQGASGMRTPPPKNISQPHILYDSVNSPGMYVIFHDTQAYPEHLITYT